MLPLEMTKNKPVIKASQKMFDYHARRVLKVECLRHAKEWVDIYRAVFIIEKSHVPSLDVALYYYYKSHPENHIEKLS